MKGYSLEVTSALVAALSLSFLTACSERRSTGPDVPPLTSATTKLPALSVYDDPIIAISDTIWGGREPNELFEIGYGITLQWPDDPALKRVSDVILRYWEPLVCADVRLHDPQDAHWVPLGSPWDNRICKPSNTYHLETVWHVSEAGIDFGETMHADDRLHLAGHSFAQVSAQLVHYRDDYRSIRLCRSLHYYRRMPEMAALTWGAGMIWVALRTTRVGEDHRYNADSIWAFDSTGARVVAFGHEMGLVWGLEYYEGKLLVLAGGNLIALDGHRNIVRSVPWTHQAGDITIAMGRLWLPGRYGNNLTGFVLDSAFWEGEIRSDWNFPLPGEASLRRCTDIWWNHYECAGIDWDGQYFYFTTYSSVAKVNLSSDLVAEYRIPVTYPRMLAWDGEAFWTMHRGPQETESATLWLSRFRLP